MAEETLDLTYISAVLCGEPWCYKPWEVGKLTLYQFRNILFAPRDDKGQVMRVPGELKLLSGERMPSPKEMRVIELMHMEGLTEEEAIRRVESELGAERQERENLREDQE